MRKPILVSTLLLLVILVAACGGEVTPDPTVVAQMAEEMVKATMTAQSAPSALTTEADTAESATNTPSPVPSTATPSPVPHTTTPLPMATDIPKAAAPVGPPAKSYSFDELGFSMDYPGTLPLIPGENRVNSDGDEDFIFIVKVNDRDEEIEGGQGEDHIAKLYAEVGQEIIKVLECVEFEVTGEGEWGDSPGGNPAWVTQGTCLMAESPIDLPLDWQSISVIGQDKVYLISMWYFAPEEDYLPDTIEASFQVFEPSISPAYAKITSKSANLRGGPGTGHSIVGSAKQGKTFEVVGKNANGTWWEICCIDGESAWVAGSIVKTGGDMNAVSVAENIPTPPPPPTPAPAAPAPASNRAGLHDRQTVSNWEIQPERVHKEKVLYHYGDSYVAMGNYAIVIVLAKNIAPGTDDLNRTLVLRLRDDKGRVYDYSDPYSAERYANIAAAWQFVVHPTPFRNINPGVETPLVMVWDVNEDVESLTLILTDGKTRAEWDLGNFSNIPPYEKE